MNLIFVISIFCFGESSIVFEKELQLNYEIKVIIDSLVAPFNMPAPSKLSRETIQIMQGTNCE